MISPKYAYTHYFFGPNAKRTGAPNVVNLYLDYNCPFSAKLFFKIQKVAPLLEKSHSGAFEFVFVNVVQPWHPNSVLLHEFALVVAQTLSEKDQSTSNASFWAVSEALFKNKESFYDSATVSLGRNAIYKKIFDVSQQDVEIKLDENEILNKLAIKEETNESKAHNSGNEATVDLKYFTRYLRTVGVHVTPTVSVNGIENGSISSGSSIEELVDIFSKSL